MSLSVIEPKAVWKFFNEIVKIPHYSGYEDKIRDYLVSFAEDRNLKYEVDSFGSVIIDVPASAGKENAPSVILQGHMDMVPVVEDGFKHDFSKEPVDAYVEDGFVKARHTTLGADNGIAIAMALAIFDDATLCHGPLRAIFTVEEETTMKGALNLDAKYLQADYLINLDSEENGYLYVNCAGSADINISFNVNRVEVEDCDSFTFELSHFTGGHSGTDITTGNANAIKVLASVLDNLSDDYDFFIQDIDGGFVRNSIPAKAKVTVSVPKCDSAEFSNAFTQCFNEQKSLYADTDKNSELTIAKAECKEALSYTQSLDLIHLLRSLPSGVARMSPRYRGTVETSVNLGTVRCTKESISICMLPRSLNKNALNDMIKTVLAQCFLLDNVDAEVGNEHEPWSSPDCNRLIDVLNDSSVEVTGKPFTITALHAGVECASFARANPSLQLVSIGPDLFNPHSIAERVSIEGTAEIYEIVRRSLAIL